MRRYKRLLIRGMGLFGVALSLPVICAAPVFANTMATTGDGVLRPYGGGSYNMQLQSFLGETGEAIRRDGTYDYGPSVIKVNNSTIRMWFCGGNTSSNTRGDSVWYSESSDYGRSGTWSAPVEVIRASNNWSYLDSSHACDPSVIRHGDNYYVFYTGAPDWRGRYGHENACNGGTANPMGCDNRIFVARVPVWAPSSRGSYQKLVNVGECASWGCFQWQPFWSGTEYPPVPVVRYEDGPVWRIIGTGSTGYTDRQTMNYGIGQPSAFNIQGKLVLWHTNNQQVNVWQKDVWNAEYAWNLMTKQDPEGQGRQFQQFVANIGNDVNYDLAYTCCQNT